MTRPIAHYPTSSPADRAAETEQVIATVRATIAPAEQAQALRDLKRGADGEPQLDEAMLEREARIAEIEDTLRSTEYALKKAERGRHGARLEGAAAMLKQVAAWADETYGDGLGDEIALLPFAPNVCEHGDHQAPEGQRFCSKACEECEHTDTPDGDGCAGICDPVRQAYADAAKHCAEEAAAIEEESALAAHVLRAASAAIAKMGGGA